MRAIRFLRLAFLAESQLAVGFDGEVCSDGRGLCGEGAVAMAVVCSGSRTRKDCGGVRPVEEEVESDSETRRCGT